jgi:hypothetical protein
MSTQRQANVTLSKPGMNLGTWATRSGGDPDRDMTDFYPGGLQTVRKIPGNPSAGDVTVTKLLADLSDAQVQALIADQQTTTLYTVTQQRLSAADSPSGGGFSWRGMIKTVQIPPMSDSNDAAVIGIVISPSNVPTYA